MTLLDAQKLVRDVDGQVAPLAGGAKETLTAARSALGQAQKSLGTLTDAATPVLKQADKTFAGTAALTGPDSATLHDLSQTLKALEDAARAIRALAAMLERNPEALLRGEKPLGAESAPVARTRVRRPYGVALLMPRGGLGRLPDAVGQRAVPHRPQRSAASGSRLARPLPRVLM